FDLGGGNEFPEGLLYGILIFLRRHPCAIKENLFNTVCHKGHHHIDNAFPQILDRLVIRVKAGPIGLADCPVVMQKSPVYFGASTISNNYHPSLELVNAVRFTTFYRRNPKHTQPKRQNSIPP